MFTFYSQNSLIIFLVILLLAIIPSCVAASQIIDPPTIAQDWNTIAVQKMQDTSLNTTGQLLLASSLPSSCTTFNNTSDFSNKIIVFEGGRYCPRYKVIEAILEQEPTVLGIVFVYSKSSEKRGAPGTYCLDAPYKHKDLKIPVVCAIKDQVFDSLQAGEEIHATIVMGTNPFYDVVSSGEYPSFIALNILVLAVVLGLCIWKLILFIPEGCSLALLCISLASVANLSKYSKKTKKKKKKKKKKKTILLLKRSDLFINLIVFFFY